MGKAKATKAKFQSVVNQARVVDQARLGFLGAGARKKERDEDLYAHPWKHDRVPMTKVSDLSSPEKRRRLGWKPSHDIPRRREGFHHTVNRVIRESERQF